MAESDESDDSQKTEDPTPKRLEESRRKGQVALSRELNTWIMLLAATIIVGGLGPGMLSRFQVLMQTYLEQATAPPPDLMAQTLRDVLGILALPLAILLFAAFIGPFIQVGPLFAPEIVKPDLGKISPVQGFKRLFSLRAVMEFIKGILKIVLIGTVGVILLSPFFGQIDHLVGLPAPLMIGEIRTLVIRLMTGILVAFFVVALIDVVFQRAQHLKKMRMSRQEIKDEYKQTEGDPHIRARLRQLRAERARQRMMQAVPKADVVITNPTHFAVALQYDPDTMEAPVCIAKGMDELALRIRALAQEHDIAIVENPPLARLLYDTLDLDDMVPTEHYKAVAEVISYVFRLKGTLN